MDCRETGRLPGVIGALVLLLHCGIGPLTTAGAIPWLGASLVDPRLQCPALEKHLHPGRKEEALSGSLATFSTEISSVLLHLVLPTPLQMCWGESQERGSEVRQARGVEDQGKWGLENEGAWGSERSPCEKMHVLISACTVAALFYINQILGCADG